MSGAFARDFLLPEVARPKRKARFTLRRRRRKILHPERVKDHLRTAVVTPVPAGFGWRWPFGWRIRARMDDGSWRTTVTAQLATYTEVCQRRASILKEPRVDCVWIERLNGDK